MAAMDFDVLIVGAGVSGIGMACQLQRACPQTRFAILEQRQAIGGTWDLFRYPGVRSDSDMFTFGYYFRPWSQPKVLADGTSIRNYVCATAQEYGVDEKIHFEVKVESASWDSHSSTWTLASVAADSGERREYHCQRLVMCTGYYNYDAGYQPDFPGMEDFAGTVLHPQQWPRELDYSNKRVVIIGSGATAVTLVPAMADTAAHVTLLQRSPTYILTLPAIDKLTAMLQKVLPKRWVFNMARRRNIRLQRWLYVAAQRWPHALRKLLLWAARQQLGKDFDMRHFQPSYMPWDERLCVVPNGDLFQVLRKGKASIVTDQIETFTRQGLRLQSGQQLDADIVVSATGLNMELMGGTKIMVDGQERAPSEVMTYKGVLVQDAPNLAVIFGYTNASWTLKADIAAGYLCRLYRHMDAQGYVAAIPRDTTHCALPTSVMDSLKSGYVRRASAKLPRQGSHLPWKVLNHYQRDRQLLLKDPLEDGVLEFRCKASSAAA